jgi:hypothetical protein
VCSHREGYIEEAIANIDWPGIRIRCSSGGATCLIAECCFIELAKCGVMWHSEFRGKYLNVNVLRRTIDDGRTDAKMTAHIAIEQLS